MKTLLMSFVFLASVSFGFAQWQGNGNQGPNNNGQYGYNQNSALVVSTFLQQQFMVVVDNNYQYQSTGSSININNLSAGNHIVTVYQWRRNLFGMQRQEIIYNAGIYFKPNVETSVYINTFGQVNIDERQIYQNNNYGNGEYGNNGNGVGYGYGRKKNKYRKHDGCGNDRYGNNNGRRGNDEDDD